MESMLLATFELVPDGEAGGDLLIRALVPLDDDAAALAELAVAAAGARVDCRPSYARVDLLRLAGRPVVSELELIEPGLYLDLLPEHAGAFAEHVLT